MLESQIKKTLTNMGCTIVRTVFDKTKTKDNQKSWYIITLPQINGINTRRKVAVSISTPSRIITNGALPWKYMEFIDRLALTVENGGREGETAYTNIDK